MGLVKWKVPVEWKVIAAQFFIHFTHDCTLVLFVQLIKTGSVLTLLPLSTVLGFTLYEDTGNGKATKHQLYSSAIKVWYAPMTLATSHK